MLEPVQCEGSLWTVTDGLSTYRVFVVRQRQYHKHVIQLICGLFLLVLLLIYQSATEKSKVVTYNRETVRLKITMSVHCSYSLHFSCSVLVNFLHLSCSLQLCCCRQICGTII